MTDKIAVSIHDVSKTFFVYDRPIDRLKESLINFVSLSNKKKKFHREFNALNGITFDIKLGETFAFIGKNGSGKSTLLQIICGIISASKGTAITNGRIGALLELGSGFNPEFTGIENIQLLASIYGLNDDEIRQRVGSILDFADIGDFIHQPIKTYSSGMVVRLAFSVVAHIDADILVVDEALSVGDAFFVQKCMRFLRQFQKRGTIIFVSHDTSAVLNLCDRAAWIDKGVLKAIGKPKDICERYLADLYEDTSVDGAMLPPPEGKSRALEQDSEGGDGALPSTDAESSWSGGEAREVVRSKVDVFLFDESASHFGKKGIVIDRVRIFNAAGETVKHVNGLDDVELRVDLKANSDVLNLIVGFGVKDRLGQIIFGDNTYLYIEGSKFFMVRGQSLAVKFEFNFPLLPSGDYSIFAAVAEGSQFDHVQHHWIHDAIILKVHSSTVATGLCGIPMRCVRLSRAG